MATSPPPSAVARSRVDEVRVAWVRTRLRPVGPTSASVPRTSSTPPPLPRPPLVSTVRRCCRREGSSSRHTSTSALARLAAAAPMAVEGGGIGRGEGDGEGGDGGDGVRVSAAAGEAMGRWWTLASTVREEVREGKRQRAGTVRQRRGTQATLALQIHVVPLPLRACPTLLCSPHRKVASVAVDETGRRPVGHPRRSGSRASPRVQRSTALLFFHRKSGRGSALLLFMFHSAMRRNEVAHLLWSDLTFDRRGVVVVIRKSKTDQEAKSQSIALPRLEHQHCPVVAMERWKAACRGEGESPVFRWISKEDEIEWRVLIDQRIVAIIKHYCAEIGHDPACFAAQLRRPVPGRRRARTAPRQWATLPAHCTT